MRWPSSRKGASDSCMRQGRQPWRQIDGSNANGINALPTRHASARLWGWLAVPANARYVTGGRLNSSEPNPASTNRSLACNGTLNSACSIRPGTHQAKICRLLAARFVAPAASPGPSTCTSQGANSISNRLVSRAISINAGNSTASQSRRSLSRRCRYSGNAAALNTPPASDMRSASGRNKAIRNASLRSPAPQAATSNHSRANPRHRPNRVATVSHTAEPSIRAARHQASAFDTAPP
ncbi:hypothetical protein [Pseudomonas sp. 34 E 7]|nr:hypothetical protein [Pseudomonas sp. 34 E 7]